MLSLLIFNLGVIGLVFSWLNFKDKKKSVDRKIHSHRNNKEDSKVITNTNSEYDNTQDDCHSSILYSQLFTGVSSSPRIPIKNINTNETSNTLSDWAFRNNVLLEIHSYEGLREEYLNKLSIVIGDNYSILKGLFNTLKYSCRDEGLKPVSYTLPINLEGHICLIQGICHELAIYKMIKYQYIKKSGPEKEKRFNITITSKGGANFILGGWFERYVYTKITDYLILNNISYECILNAQILRTNGQRNEIDILFMINNQPFWVECKSGATSAIDYNLSKYLELSKEFKLDPCQFLIVSLNEPSKAQQDKIKDFGLTITGKDFVPSLEKFLNKTTETLELYPAQGL